VFQVKVDGVQIFDSGTKTGTSAPQNISLDVTGKNTLTLIVTDGGDGSTGDSADWANARLTCSAPADTSPPTVNTVSPAAGATGVAVAVPVTATFSESMLSSSLTPTSVTLAKQ